MQRGAGSRGGTEAGSDGGEEVALETVVFLFVLLKCYTDSAAFNYAGGGVRP